MLAFCFTQNPDKKDPETKKLKTAKSGDLKSRDQRASAGH